MSRFNIILLLVLFVLSSSHVLDEESYIFRGEKLKGVSLVGPPDPFESNPFMAIKDVHANWVAIVPYGYSPIGKATIKFSSQWQWWGESLEGAKQSIRIAKKNGMKVMLKPQVYIHNAWVGDMDFETEEEWKQWENDYDKFIVSYLKLAASENVDLFCIGTEYKISTKKREKYWRDLIAKARTIYDGPLVYSANWDSYKQVAFWDEVDFIGISSYFPLSTKKTPQQKELIKAWRPITRKLRKFSKHHKKPILFTEYGYLTVDGCADKTWLLENRIHLLQENQQAQANALNALFTTFWNEPYWAGGFLWKWFPEMKGHEGYIEKDYTPQGKMSEQIIERWYQRN